MKFYSYESVGNKFLLLEINSLKTILNNPADLFSGLKANIQTQVIKNGCDGLLALVQQKTILVFNADGSYGQFSVNGARCAAYHVLRGSEKKRISFFVGDVLVEALRAEKAGAVTIRLCQNATVEPLVLSSVKGFFVDVGNPHFVVLQKIDKKAFLQQALILAQGNEETGGAINVSYFWLKDDGAGYKGIVYERGVGPTLSCGSAALALVNVLLKTGRLNLGDQISIYMPGGVMMGLVLDERCIEITAHVSCGNLIL
ncbi:hypothetical protein KAU11_00785 [Candidatus Babeliales bacterium]|nr:hypothetical protein [Candidatus Babeliales bacterium]